MMVYITLLLILMMLVTISKIMIIYFGFTEAAPMVDYMNNLVLATVLLKSSAVLINFLIGEVKNGKQRTPYL